MYSCFRLAVLTASGLYGTAALRRKSQRARAPGRLAAVPREEASTQQDLWWKQYGETHEAAAQGIIAAMNVDEKLTFLQGDELSWDEFQIQAGYHVGTTRGNQRL